MPMPIQTLEEYDKVLNVSWYSPEKPGDEQVYYASECAWQRTVNKLTSTQLPLHPALLKDVPLVLHRHTKFPEPILLFCQ